MAKTLRKKIEKEIILLDGAFGTYLESVGIKKEDLSKLFRIDVHHTTQGTKKEKGMGNDPSKPLQEVAGDFCPVPWSAAQAWQLQPHADHLVVARLITSQQQSSLQDMLNGVGQPSAQPSPKPKDARAAFDALFKKK